MNDVITVLRASGVIIPAPSLVHVADEVDPGRIGAGTVLHPGTRLSGAELAIGPDCVIGAEGSVVLRDSQLGARVTLGSGSVARSTLLDGAGVGPGAQLRPGCLLEEGVSCSHSVGLKQTVLMPHVVLGSLVNFCDCLMAGGTSRSNHSEVGSSYVHFNYTPHRDKATPSLIGDVPSGVMLDQPPIFLGGQGGIVGPVRIAYGTVLAAGTVYRRDVLEPGLLVAGAPVEKAGRRPYQPGLYGDIRRIVRNNMIYLGNLHALREWYRHVRARFMTEPAAARCRTGALQRLDELIDERVRQLETLTARLAESLARARSQYPHGLPEAPFALHRRFVDGWDDLKPHLASGVTYAGDVTGRDRFLVQLGPNPTYIDAVKQLAPVDRELGTRWLTGIVSEVVGQAIEYRPPDTDASHHKEIS